MTPRRPSPGLLFRIGLTTAAWSPLLRRVFNALSDDLPLLPPWAREGRRSIRTWFEETQSRELAHKRGGDPDNMISNCMASNCSLGAFSSMDKVLTHLAQSMNRKDLHGLTGAVLGCDWGFPVLHAAAHWSPAFLIGLDSNGKFGPQGAELIRRHPDVFPNAAIESGGLSQLEKSPQHFDFILITRSFNFLDTPAARHDLLAAASALRTDGTMMILLREVDRDMSDSDLVRTLEAAGCPGAEVQTSPTVGKRLLAHKSTHVPTTHVPTAEAQKRLAQAQQDGPALIARLREPLASAQTREERISGIRRQIEARESRLDTLPLNYMLKMTSRCNIRCVFCDYSDIKRHYGISPVLLHQIQSTLAGTNALTMSGGEPLLCPETLPLMRHVLEHPGPKLSLATNMLAAKPHTELMAQSLYHVACSLDAACAKTYEQVRNGSSWRSVTANLEALVRSRSTLRIATPTLSLSFILMDHNLAEAADFIDFAADLGADAVNYHWLCWTLTPRASRSMVLDLSDDRTARALCSQLLEIAHRAEARGIELIIAPAVNAVRRQRPDLYDEYRLAHHAPQFKPLTLDTDIQTRRFPCAMPFTWMRVLSSEHACFCHSSRPAYRYIPVHPSAPLADNWNHPLFVEARSHFQAGRFEEVCSSDCPLYQSFLAKTGETPCP